MAQVLVRNLDHDVKERLQQRARRHGHSMEEEIRTILRQALADHGSTQRRAGFAHRRPLCRPGLDRRPARAARTGTATGDV